AICGNWRTELLHEATEGPSVFLEWESLHTVPKNGVQSSSWNGLNTFTPNPAKPLAFRVATVQPCARAVAAINESRTYTLRPWARAADVSSPQARASSSSNGATGN